MYSICTNFFPDDTEAMVGYIEAVSGFGCILGPLIGTGLKKLGGYDFIFYAFGGLFIFLSLWIFCIFPERIDGEPPEANPEDNEEE